MRLTSDTGVGEEKGIATFLNFLHQRNVLKTDEVIRIRLALYVLKAFGGLPPGFDIRNFEAYHKTKKWVGRGFLNGLLQGVTVTRSL